MGTNILLINHAYPPDEGVETLRVSKFAKYLNEIGYDIHVLSRLNNNKYKYPKDNLYLESITRTNIQSWPKILVKSKEFRWIKPLMTKALDLIESKNIDVVLHSAPHFIPLAAAIPINKTVDVSYIIDLRDPWTVGPSLSGDGLKGGLYKRLSKSIEPIVFSKSDAIILNNNRMENIYSEKYPMFCDKFHTITNGFDPDDFDNITPTENKGFEIIYPGKFYSDMNLFFEVLQSFGKRHDNVLFSHFGCEDTKNVNKIKINSDKLEITNLIRFNGYVPREEVLSSIMTANIGLIETRIQDPTHIPMKTYDYIGSNTPILAVDDGNGALRDLLNPFPNGYVVSRDNKEQIYQVLERVYHSEHEKLNTDQMRNYSIKNLTDDLDRVIKTVS